LAATEQVFFDPMPPGIGCERCHGPGERHVHSGRAEDIVNPARLSPTRQLDVCAQCHESDHLALREGKTDFGYRPGEDLASTQVSWVAQPPEADRFMLLAHPERLIASACFQRSGGALRCTSCHDPHVSSIDEPASWWDSKCNTCHATHPCTEDRALRQAQGDHCVACHMRKGPTSRLPLVSVTDHFIQRRPPPVRPGFTETPPNLVSWPGLLGEPAAGADLTALEALAWADVGARDRATKLVMQAAESGADLPALYERVARHFEDRGAPATAALAYAHVLHEDPDSRSALLGYAHARMTVGGAEGRADGLRALDRALAIDGDDPVALEAKAMALFAAGRTVEAQPLFEHAAAAAPWTSASHVALAAIALRTGDRDAALTHLEAARRIEPSDAWVIDRLVAEYTARGDKTRADDVARTRAALSAIGREPGSTPASGWLPDSWR
jgi:predicted CXXCH cytochrome family protein